MVEAKRRESEARLHELQSRLAAEASAEADRAAAEAAAKAERDRVLGRNATGASRSGAAPRAKLSFGLGRPLSRKPGR